MTHKLDDETARFVADFKARTGKDVTIHLDRTTQPEDYDALDPNSYETTCAKCDATIIGQFGPKGELQTPCSQCGSLETKGGLSSPAGAMHLAMFDPIMP